MASSLILTPEVNDAVSLRFILPPAYLPAHRKDKPDSLQQLMAAHPIFRTVAEGFHPLAFQHPAAVQRCGSYAFFAQAAVMAAASGSGEFISVASNIRLKSSS